VCGAAIGYSIGRADGLLFAVAVDAAVDRIRIVLPWDSYCARLSIHRSWWSPSLIRHQLLRIISNDCPESLFGLRVLSIVSPVGARHVRLLALTAWSDRWAFVCWLTGGQHPRMFKPPLDLLWGKMAQAVW